MQHSFQCHPHPSRPSFPPCSLPLSLCRLRRSSRHCRMRCGARRTPCSSCRWSWSRRSSAQYAWQQQLLLLEALPLPLGVPAAATCSHSWLGLPPLLAHSLLRLVVWVHLLASAGVLLRLPPPLQHQDVPRVANLQQQQQQQQVQQTAGRHSSSCDTSR